MTINFATNQVDLSLLGDSIELNALSEIIAKTYFVKKYRDVLSVSTPKGQVFIFDYGVVISWGISESKKSQITEMVTPQVSQAMTKQFKESFVFEVAENTSLSMIEDHINLPDAKTLTLLAISHALAQSATLSRFEVMAERTIKDNMGLSQSLAKTGKIPLSRNKMSMLRGALICTKSDILLHFNLFDTPEFFAEYPEQESKYLTLSRYLDLKPRVELLSMKLSSINELHQMLAAEQNHKHWSFLGWLIIILIAVEIVLFFVH